MNHPSLRLLIYPGLAALLSLAAAGTLAQPEEREAPSWYQVEMIVFSREGDGVEQWPRNIQLNYPLDWVELKAPGEASANDETAPSWDRGLAAINRTQREQLAFVRLPEDARSMGRYAGAINRDGSYQVLFHEAWRQPMVEFEQSPAILIMGGDSFGDHYELEGSVILSVSRYLHLHTRLWLTRFEPNFGQPPGAWPELPHRPDLPLPEGTEPEPTWMDDSSWSDNWSSGDTWDTSLNSAASTPDFLGDDYLPSRIVTLNQQRRMRSEELHYIDHPLMGLLIRITPYEFPDEETTGNSGS